MVREISGAKTQFISRVIMKMLTHYKKVRGQWNNVGFVDTERPEPANLGRAEEKEEEILS